MPTGWARGIAGFAEIRVIPLPRDKSRSDGINSWANSPFFRKILACTLRVFGIFSALDAAATIR